MSNKAKPARDAFAFSLGGISAVSSFFITPAVADDLINEVRDGRLRGLPEGQPGKAEDPGTFWGRFWLSRRTNNRVSGSRDR